MLLIYAGPLLSQMQQMGHAEHHEASGHQHGNHAHHGSDHHSLGNALEACGYCTLLLSNPALSACRIDVNHSPANRLRLARAPYSTPALFIHFPKARPRAPPVIA
ncbi:DUF2946 domain-containing protein [Pseudomonas sp. ABC1]|nr:DUF2946 domain-containing protein [Pseudomonas sp. ABC1]